MPGTNLTRAEAAERAFATGEGEEVTGVFAEDRNEQDRFFAMVGKR